MFDEQTAEAVRKRIGAAVAEAFLASSAERARDPHHMSLSKLGGCTRAAAYTLAHTEVSEPATGEEGRAANLGTWEHEGLLPVLAAQLPGARYEQPTRLTAAGLQITGTLDLDVDDLIVDLKTVGERRLHGVRRAGPYADHRLQVLGYALAQYQSGRDVRWVVWLYLDRATGEVEIVVEEFTNAAASAVIDRVAQLRYFSRQPDAARRDGYGPGLSLACDSCPWLRRCWGDDAVAGEVGAQRNLTRFDDQAVEQALALYDAASARGAAADRDQRFAKAILDGSRVGYYGPWALRRGKPSSHIDTAAMQARYAAHGWEVPTRTSSGRLLIRLAEALSPKMRKELAAAMTEDEAASADTSATV